MSNENVEQKGSGLGSFQRYLTVWVAACIVIGVAVGRFLPVIPETLSQWEYAQVSIPTAILIWLMIYPMMLKIDFSSIVEALKMPKGLIVTCATNWLIKPFTMFFFAWLFLKVIFANFIPDALATEYLAGAVLLGAAPCTAMVFVWSHLTKGNPAYTLVQVAVNDLIILVAFTPIVAFLLGVGDVSVPLDTLILSTILFVVIPLLAGYLSRKYVIKNRGMDYFENVFLKKFDNITTIGLLLTLIMLFSFQGDVIMNNPFHIVLIAVPLTIQTFFIFFFAYGWAKAWKLPHNVAAPAGMIGASNFFELSVAVAISLFGLQSGAALATVVGVLVEVPTMLALVKIANNTRHWFPEVSKGN
ncbi:ACR3 family arsenite efflux transporter [Alkaliphilus oremlandii]|uniref:Arsenical-resistance protein n=1 Tax=Alkaliphilus oremlandii (strain OhILAs) TaxID=350688 RepID=A8MGW6_ALKOO|nr:ACR3 family arsenite efflux transporter [Alkaliphilus oremlandii]ABW18660.1 arsenical-resistance protein [Alkaliphilus oremlandii OhILAs]